MQGNTFSSTKITLPRLRTDLVARPQLEARLREALASCKLVLLTAPAGYGKTVALVQQLSRLPQGHAVAWVSASGDDDLQRLLAALLAALDPFDLPWRISPQALPEMALNPQQLGTAVDALAGALLRAEVEHGVMAFDDLHCVADPRVFNFLDRLLEVLPANWTVAVTSRVDPPLALARLLVRREAAEFRQPQLRFQREDVQALLETARLAAAPENVDRLLEHTQGWPAGLSVEMLAREHMPREHSTRVQRRMFDYLAQEVLQQLPPPLQSFLLRCSVLPELSAERCAQVSGDPDAARWLAELERRELFVTVLDTEALTLRLHALFREFLESRLLREHFEELPQLLHRAADGEPDLVPRVGYLLRASAAQEAAQQMLEAAATMIQTGSGEQLPRLIEQFPEPLRASSPELAYVRGLWAWHRFELNAMHASMLTAMVGFERNEQRQLAIRARGWASVALYTVGRLTQAFELWDDAPCVEMDAATQAMNALLAFLRRSTQYGPRESTGPYLARLVQLFRTSGSDECAFFFNTCPAYVGRWGIRPAMEDLVDALRAASGDTRPLMKLSALRLQAWLALWRGDIDAARDLFREVVAEAAWLGNPPHVVTFNQVLIAFERHLSGERAEAQEILRRVADAAARNPQRRSQILYVNLLAGLASASDDWPTVRQALLTIEAAQRPGWPRLEAPTTTLRAELALHAHDDAEAVSLLRPLVDHATQGDAFGVSYRLRIALARAELRAGTAQAAWEVLGPALHEAMKAGEPLGFLLCGAKALDELAHAHWPTTADAPALAYLRECASRARQLRASTSESAPAQPVGGLLSEREREVLELVAQGQSNKLIARALDLSPHTVKRHMARIFDKTGQASRGQVAAWYRGETERRAAAG